MIHSLHHDYQRIRDHSVDLMTGLSAEDAQAQSMPDASPIKWHLAHTTWFFETFILEQHEPAFTPFRDTFRGLYNSYYNSIGEQYPRSQRGLITRPSLDEVIAYRHAIDRRIAGLIDTQGLNTDWAPLMVLGLQHEQQHQELMLTDLKHLLSLNPAGPIYRPEFETFEPPAECPRWISLEGGLIEIGADGFAGRH